MAQIGEFAFIVATLGLSLGVISDFLFPVAVGASAITTFTTPYLIKFSEPFYHFLERILPPKLIRRLNNYSSGTQDIQAENKWKKVLKSYSIIILTNGIILLALGVFSISFLIPLLNERIDSETTARAIGLIISLAFAFPFLWALMARRPNNMAYKEMWLEKKYSHGPLLLLEIVRALIGVFLVSVWVFWLFDTQVAIFIAVPIIIVLMFVLNKRIQSFYQRIEGRFLGNLNARQTEEFNSLTANVSRKSASIEAKLIPWDAHIVQLEVPAEADYIGRTLRELAWREKYGINIVYIKRGEKLINIPDRNSILLPFDHVGIIATDEQIQSFKPIFDSLVNLEVPELDVSDISLQKIVVNEYTKLKGLNIRNSGLRERTNGLIIGIERNNQRLLNPESTTVFEWGDIVWIVGERKKIQYLASETE
jgi:CPA2 family monovalent cation:H+ antiporter-2